MQVSAIGKLRDIIEDIGEEEEVVVLTGSREDLKTAAPHFLSSVKLVSRGALISIMEAAEGRDFSAVIEMTRKI